MRIERGWRCTLLSIVENVILGCPLFPRSAQLPFPFLLSYSPRTHINDSTERPTAVNIGNGKSREGEFSCSAIPFQGPSTNVDKDLGIITASCVSLLFNSGNHFHQVVHAQLWNPSSFSAWPIMIHHWSDQFKLKEMAKIYICPAYLDFLSGVRSGSIFTRQWTRTRSRYNQITVTGIQHGMQLQCRRGQITCRNNMV